MVLEYLENIVQLLLILVALLASLFRYISSKKRGWLYAVIFFTSSLLSSYFWTSYLVIMGDSPNASVFLTYFGWNVSYFVLLLLTIHVKPPPERNYFHPLMLVPVPLNIVQLVIYLKFGSVLNNLYQVTVCTIISCSCLQSILYAFKNRKNGAKPAYIVWAILVYTAAEFGMWTASCYEGWANYVYYLCSFLCSISYLLLIWAIRQTYADDDTVETVKIDPRIQNFLKGSYLGSTVVCSLGGIVLCGWIRDVLVRSTNASSETEVFHIICVILFLISCLLAAVAVAIILIVYFEQKISENSQLREEKQVAERSNAAKSDFLANMSHEIRTPLNAVLGMNRMIALESLKARENPPEDKEQVRKVMADITEYAGNIESAGNNLLSIINDILDFSKIEAGKLDIIEHEYQLSSVLNDVSNIVLFRAEGKGLDFRAEIDEHVPDRLYGDDMRLRQIISNLLNNAVKYTDSGTVTLSLRSEQGHQPGERAELVIAVKDTGIGIKPEDLDKIFVKFERTELERNSTVEGTGLGLAITQHLLEMMNGSIHVESTYGAGSVFTVRIPQRIVSTEPIGDFRAKLERSMDSTRAADQLFRAPDARILIVDDTRMNLSVAAGLIRDTGIQTDTAESGAAALQLCSVKHYDLILLDQRMPVMDGTETLRRLRAQEDGLPTPVICLTADALTGAKEHYLSAGFDDYLSKPIDSRALKQILMRYLPQDKILPADEIPQPKTDTAEADRFAVLRQAGIDIVTGLGYCQEDTELFAMILHEFVQSADAKKRDLARYFGEHNLKDYGILVHALKSAARMIGAESLAKEAAALEKAADRGDWTFVEGSHSNMLEHFDAIVDEIAAAAGDAMQTGAAPEDEEILEFFPAHCSE